MFPILYIPGKKISAFLSVKSSSGQSNKVERSVNGESKKKMYRPVSLQWFPVSSTWSHVNQNHPVCFLSTQRCSPLMISSSRELKVEKNPGTKKKIKKRRNDMATIVIMIINNKSLLYCWTKPPTKKSGDIWEVYGYVFLSSGTRFSALGGGKFYNENSW